MMVVMVIIAVIVSVSTPSITAGIDAVRLATATSTVASFLNSAVNLAERRQRPVELIVSPKDNRIEFLPQTPAPGASLPCRTASSSKRSSRRLRMIPMPVAAC
jgi:Tfp pilus assembly protein FimT